MTNLAGDRALGPTGSLTEESARIKEVTSTDERFQPARPTTSPPTQPHPTAITISLDTGVISREFCLMAEDSRVWQPPFCLAPAKSWSMELLAVTSGPRRAAHHGNGCGSRSTGRSFRHETRFIYGFSINKTLNLCLCLSILTELYIIYRIYIKVLA